MKYLLFVMCLSYATVAHGAPEIVTPDEITVRLLPAYTPCSENGIRYACYSLEQQKMLLSLESDAQTWQTKLRLTETALTETLKERDLVYAQLKLTEANEDLSVKRIKVLTDQLNTDIKEKNDWRAKAESPVVWPYVIGGVVGLLGLGFGLGAVLGH